MPLTVNVNVRFLQDDPVRRELAVMNGLIRKLIEQGDQIMATIADVKAAVTAQGTVIQSVITLLGQLHQMLTDALANDDPAAVQEVLDQIAAQQQALADAVVANTPATPPPA